MSTYTVSVKNQKMAQALMATLVRRSCWFACEPVPDGEYQITVKEENTKLIDTFLAVREGAESKRPMIAEWVHALQAEPETVPPVLRPLPQADEYEVMHPDAWENDTGPKDWWAVSNLLGIVAYFEHEADACEFQRYRRAARKGENARFEPWTDGCSVGFRVVYSDGVVEYMYLTPPVEGTPREKNNSMDVYVGRLGDPNRDRRLYDIKL